MPSVNDELLPRLEPIDEIRVDDLKEKCECCHGRRVIPSEKVILRQPCTRCGGEGKLYWVDKAMPKSAPINRDVLRDSVQQNIIFLIQLIQQQAGMLGCTAQVDVKPLDYDPVYGPMHSHSMRQPLYFRRNEKHNDLMDAVTYMKKMGGF